MLRYIVDGQPYNVKPEDKESFEKEHPGFELMGGGQFSAPPEGDMKTFQIGGKYGDVYNVAAQDMDAFMAEFAGAEVETPPIEHADSEGFIKATNISLFKQEDEVVKYLNKQYEGQGVRFTFGEGDFQDTIEVLVGDQKEGEGEKFNLDFDDEDNLRIFQKIKTHIDNYTKPDTYGWTRNMQEQWPEMESQIQGVLDDNFVGVRDDFIRGKSDSSENVSVPCPSDDALIDTQG